MAAYLFVWNPKKWEWKTLGQDVEETRMVGHKSKRWSCASHKSVRIGDRAFLLRLGVDPKGVMGSGFIVTDPFLSQHWSIEDRLVPRVNIEFDTLLHPDHTPLLSIEALSQKPLSAQTWTPQASGISILPEIVPELEAAWFDFLASDREQAGHMMSEHAGKEGVHREGAQNRTEATRYERNPHARRVCIEHHGLTCSVCGFDFLARYGQIGRGFIHIHHLQPVAATGAVTTPDPAKDLRPVCPNCHAMLHQESPPMTIKELKARINTDKGAL